MMHARHGCPSLLRPWYACALGVWVCGAWLGIGWVIGSELRETPIVKAVQSARPAVVNIRGEKTVGVGSAGAARAEASKRVNGMGTGVIIDHRGYIMTNHHVVDGVKEIQVTTADGQRFIARLVARDPETDLAIIKVDASEPLPVIKFGTSSDLMAGESVVALGNAYGYEHTATRGIISALHRAVQVSDAQFYDDLIQTDASINPGNSGGPLLNVDGEMIGINVAVRAGAQGIGFAIPVDKAAAVAAELLASCSVRNAWHGVVLSEDRPHGEGLVVTSVEPGSPAAAAGLSPGDIILEVGNLPTRRALDFQRAILDLGAGEEVAMVVRRADQRLDLRLTLAPAPERAKPRLDPVWELLGLELKPIPADQFRQTYQTRYRGGLTITAVRPQSPAALQGLRPGDVLVGMHIWETVSLENVNYVLNRPDFPALVPLKFYILRGQETFYGYLPVAMKSSTPQ